MMEWAADPANRPVINRVVANTLQTEAVTIALDQMFEEAKSRIKAMLEGQIGAGRKEILETFKDAIPEQAQAILKHPAVSTFIDVVQVAGQIATMFGKRREIQ